MQAGENRLQWLDEESRTKILSHPQIMNYNQLAPHRQIFVPIFKVSQQTYSKFTKKQYIAFGVEQAPLDLLHPIQYAYVRLEIREMQLLHRFKSAVQFHENNPLENVQKIYNHEVKGFQNVNYNVLTASCENYKYTLADVLDLIRKNEMRGFNKAFVEFMRSFLFRAYLSILYGISHPASSQLCLSYSFQPKNIMIDNLFKLMLGNPIFGGGYPSPLLAYENNKQQKYINGYILQEIKSVMKQVIQNSNLKEIPEMAKDITFKVFGRKQEFFKVSEQIEQITQVIKNFDFIFEFPDQQILPYLRDIQYKLDTVDNKKAKFQLSQLSRNRAHLRKISESYK